MKKRDTKRSLIASIMSLVLCITMLLGTTLAWFTDSVSSGVNKIQAGNLDVEVLHTNAKVTAPTSIEGEESMFPDVDGNSMKWEPGAVSYENFTVKNVGTLAFKYNMRLNITDYNAVSGTDKTLKDVLKVMILEGENIKDTVNRTTVEGLNWEDATSLDQFAKSNAVLYPAGSNPSEEKFQVIVYWQPSDNDNEWNVNNGKTTTDGEPLFIDFGINLVASQYQSENDSFGPDYDQGIVLPDLPVSINKTFQSEPITTASVNEDVQVKNASTAQGVATVPADSVNTVLNELLNQASDKKENSDISTVIYLNVTTEEKTENTVTYDINMSAKMTYTKNSGETGNAELTNLDGYLNDKIVTVQVEVGKGLENVAVKHNAESMNQLSSVDENAEGFYYNKQTGMLTIKSKSFSPFTIAYSLDAVAVVDGTTYGTLSDAVAAAQVDKEVTLIKNVELTEQLLVDKDIILNLNGKKISYNGEALGSGVIGVKRGGKLTVNDNNGGEINSGDKAYAAIALTVKGEAAEGNPAEVVINGGTLTGKYYAVVGNGTRHNTNITINGGTINGIEGLAIYHPQDGTMTINGGTFSGPESAVELRAGILNITGGTFTSTATEFRCDPNGSGTTTVGAALAIAQHTTKKDISVDISGGTFNGVKAINESNPQANDPAPQVTLNVTGGVFNGEVSVVDAQKFIKGGTFSSDPSAFVSSGYEVNKIDSKFEVKKIETWSDHAADSIPYDENENVYIISTPEQLAKFAHMVNEEKNENDKGNTFSGKTVKLANDIDLGAYVWIPVGQTGATQFMGTFDGNNHTIKNLCIKNQDEGGNCSTGLFGWLNTATVQNLTVDGANISGHHNVGVIAGYMETAGCKIINCIVKNANVSCTSVNDDANGDKCGGIVGHAGNAGVSVTNCTVSNSTISAGRDAGQVVGAALKVNVTDCSAENVNVSANGTSTGANIRNEVIGREL